MHRMRKEICHMEENSLDSHLSCVRTMASYNFLNYYLWNKESMATEHTYAKKNIVTFTKCSLYADTST